MSKKYIDIFIIGFIFLILFTMPALFIRIDGVVSWRHVIKIWQDNILLVPIFAINHWLLMPQLMYQKKYPLYFVSILILIVFGTWLCNMIDPQIPARSLLTNGGEPRPTPIPPYANMLMYAILIVGVDIGLFFSRMWQQNKQHTLELEKKNTEMELDLLRNQVSPHFFMNTLNNIYSLTESNSSKAKKAIMKLSKMMRYLLYENSVERVKLSKEFEFIHSYIDLMRLRYTDNVIFDVEIPDTYYDINIPPMLFVEYIENAVKYGVSYQEKCIIMIKFKLTNDQLQFFCHNTIYFSESSLLKGGIGLKNTKNRLDHIYGTSYNLTISKNENQYDVSLTIPIV